MSVERIRDLRARAAHARELSRHVVDDQVTKNLTSYFADLEAEADKLEKAEKHQPAGTDPAPADPDTAAR